MKRINLFVLSILLLIGLMAGCGSGPAKENGEKNNNQNEENAAHNDPVDEEETSFPVTVTDGNGEEFTMEEEPETIVSLMPSNTEIAFALGVGEKVVAGSDFDNYPEEALELEKIGGMELNIEAIVALDPDLVIAHATNTPDGIEQLQDAGLKVLIVNNATNFEEVYVSIEMMSKVTGTAAKGEEIIEQMKDDLASLTAKAEEVAEADMQKVFIEISPAPEIYTPGKGTFENEILSVIRAENGAGDEEGWVMLSEEAIIQMNPDVIIVTYDYIDNAVEEIMNRDGWQDLTAVKNEQVIVVDPDLVSRPGPRLVEGAEILAKAIYPDVFGE